MKLAAVVAGHETAVAISWRAPAKVVGRACAVVKNGTDAYGTWTMNDGTARVDSPGFQTSHTWKVPTVPPAGAPLTDCQPSMREINPSQEDWGI